MFVDAAGALAQNTVCVGNCAFGKDVSCHEQVEQCNGNLVDGETPTEAAYSSERENNPHAMNVKAIGDPGIVWVQVDLGSLTTINRVIMDSVCCSGRIYAVRYLALSRDGLYFFTGNSKYVLSRWGAGGWRNKGDKARSDWIIPTVNTRFVRVYSTGDNVGDDIIFFELEVYGPESPETDINSKPTNAIPYTDYGPESPE